MKSDNVPTGTPVDRLVMPSVAGWYLVEIAGVISSPGNRSGFSIDYCREASVSDGGGMEWIDNYAHNVVAWHGLPVKSA